MNVTLTDTQLLDALVTLAREAGIQILKVYDEEFVVEHKADTSPVTIADRLAEDIIVEGLHALAPNIPILAEERAASGEIPVLGDTFFLIDPLDGTKEFISGNGEFTVNIALIRSRKPVLGVVYAPAIGQLYAGSLETGARVQEYSRDVSAKPLNDPRPITARLSPLNGLTAVASRSHRTPETDDYLAKLNVSTIRSAGSSLKFCLLAEGKADIYPRFGRTMEWDTGAGQAVLEAAGGRVVEHPGGEALVYGKTSRGFDNPYFIASGRLIKD